MQIVKENGQLVYQEPLPDLNIRSDEVQEILSKAPSWLLRSGSGVIFFLLLVLLFAGWFIKYPEIVDAPVIVTTAIPPATIVSKTNGYLSLWVKDKQDVHIGDYVGYLKNPADINSMLQLITEIKAFKNNFYQNPLSINNFVIKDYSGLGEVQMSYNNFLRSIRNYQFATRQQIFRKKANSLSNEIYNYSVLAEEQKEQTAIMSKELGLSEESFRRDSLLYLEKVISESEFEQKKKEHLMNARAYKNTVSGITNTTIQKAQLESKVIDLTLAEKEENKQLIVAVETAINELDGSIKQWEENYLLISPIDGTVALFTYWTNGQYTKAMDEILTIIPSNKNFFARAQAPVRGSGKIKPGQKVNIKLDNYPFEQYGILQGRIKNISLLPKENKYVLDIEILQGVTTSGKQIEYKQEMSGKGEIVTEDLRLLQRLFYQFKSFIK